MGILETLKIKKGADQPKAAAKKAKKDENVLDMVKEGAPEKAKKAPAVLKESTGNAYRILIRPQLSEKANMLSTSGKYVFRVSPEANKPEIAKAISKVYDVHVKSVQVINVIGKSRRYGRSKGRTGKWKKAIVTVAAGEKIEGVTETV